MMTTIKTFRISALITAVLFAGTIFTSANVLAAPKGINPNEVGQLLYNFNILAVPHDVSVSDTGDCPNSGHRIFFPFVESGQVGTILWRIDPLQQQKIAITDCDGTDGTAEIDLNGIGKFFVFVRLVGPMRSALQLQCIDDAANLDTLCLLDPNPITLRRTESKSFTKVMGDLLANDLEGVTWDLDSVTGFRHLQVRIYQATVQ